MASPARRARDRGLVPARVLGGVAVACTTAIALAMLAGAASSAATPPLLRDLPSWLALLGVAACVLLMVSSWLIAGDRPSAAAAVALAATGLVVPAWAGFKGLPDPMQAVAVASAPLAVAGAAGIALAWTQGAWLRRTRRLVLVATLLAAGILVGGYNPIADPGCTRTCVDVEPPLAGAMDTRTAFTAAAVLCLAASLVAVVAVLRSPRLRPRSIAGPSAIALGLLALPQAAHAVRWTDAPAPAADLLPPVLAGLLLGGAPLLAVAGARRVRRDLDELVDALADAASPGRMAGGLVRAVEFAVPDDGRWVDAAGRPVEAQRGDRWLVALADGTGPAVRLDVGRHVHPQEVLAIVTPATQLALRIARLAALRRLRVEEVRASQRRIVATSDAVRQRVERDLHDGAQQRLVSVALHLSLARRRLPQGGPDAARVARAEEHVGLALARLRQLGHGIFPAALATEGLAAALEDLARTSDVAVRLDLPPLALDRDVALAAYAVVDAALAEARSAGPGWAVRVEGVTDGVSAQLRVATGAAEATPAPALGAMGEEDGPGWVAPAAAGATDHEGVPAAFVEPADRVGAVGGTLVVRSRAGGTQLEAMLPCAS
jgi:signal transduction histidine kinase